MMNLFLEIYLPCPGQGSIGFAFIYRKCFGSSFKAVIVTAYHH
ncbi:hypothetical protein D1BOALGB6SA_7406 [Olavius sp. associated proteobacterium Delta 1]|nr:hypothetical protein D1BOALGB6SA_7406 [Olavius sp. associated proteobacterium Delta 1]